MIPESYRYVVETIGIERALVLVQKWGGRSVWVPAPERLDDEHELVKTLGRDAATKLSKIAAQDRIRVPRCETYLVAMRDEMIRKDYAAGKTAASLASEHRLTERHVFRILAGKNVVIDDRQRRLL